MSSTATRGGDAIVVGAGPNGLMAAIVLARAGWNVVVYEAASTAGGGTRTEELAVPGVLHDVCSAIHPLAVGSPAFRELASGDRTLAECVGGASRVLRLVLCVRRCGGADGRHHDQDCRGSTPHAPPSSLADRIEQSQRLMARR